MDEETTRQRGGAGFTLTELLVAMAITGFVSLAVFAVMSSTSDSMETAESAAATLDSARFALGRIETQLQNAASLGTVDSHDDPYAQPRPHVYKDDIQNASCDVGMGGGGGGGADTTPRRIAGLISYGGDYDDAATGNNGIDGWQDYAEQVMPDDIRDANPDAEFDGIIVVGAYDFPTTFDVTDATASSGAGCGESKVMIPPTQRGLYQLGNVDPFDIAVERGAINPDAGGGAGQVPEDSLLASAEGGDEPRVLRIMDHSGYSQFARICGAEFVNTGAGFSQDGLEIGLQDLLYFKSGSDSDERYGLEPCTAQSGDVSYRASLLDSYWLRVRQDPNDPANYQLVKNRIDISDLMTELAEDDGGDPDNEVGWGNVNPWNHAVDPESPVVIANRVVDFQLWFDCANSNDTSTPGVIDDDVPWESKWEVPDGESDDEWRNCLDPEDPDPARVRSAHIRLSMRTRGERADLGHVPFPKGTERMQTFDIDPNARGAARVVTTQMDVELPNYAGRNIVDTDSTD